MERLLSAQQAADRLGVSIRTVSRLARAGRLASVLIGRRRLFAEEDLDAFVRETRRRNESGPKTPLAESAKEDSEAPLPRFEFKESLRKTSKMGSGS